MKSLFDPVVQQIIGLLEQQLKASKSESNLDIKVSSRIMKVEVTPSDLMDTPDHMCSRRLRGICLPLQQTFRMVSVWHRAHQSHQVVRVIPFAFFDTLI